MPNPKLTPQGGFSHLGARAVAGEGWGGRGRGLEDRLEDYLMLTASHFSGDLWVLEVHSATNVL